MVMVPYKNTNLVGNVCLSPHNNQTALILQIRVPTHENGNCLFWEFATDHYDIAFGVYFEWTISPDDNVQVHVSDSSDDEDEETAPDGMFVRSRTF